MSDISTWSTTAGNNNSASPDGFPEGMAPSGLNNSSREVMAAVRTQHEQAAWIDLGDTPTRTGDTTFTLVGDQTAQYTVDRRIRCTDSSTLYGAIGSSVYTSLTTVTVTLDSGALSASLSGVAVGILDENAGISTTTEIAAAILAATPVGIIHLWSGSIATIPTGFGLCDGSTYGTTVAPDLTNRFIYGAESDSGSSTLADVGDTGGNNNMTDHTHTDDLAVANDTHKHNITTNNSDNSGSSVARGGAASGSTGSTLNDTHNHNLTGSVGSGSAATSTDNRPAFYSLAYIIKHDG